MVGKDAEKMRLDAANRKGREKHAYNPRPADVSKVTGETIGSDFINWHKNDFERYVTRDCYKGVTAALAVKVYGKE